MPEVVVIAGPNGAGKSTFAPDLLRKHYSNIPFLNADAIAVSIIGSATNVDDRSRQNHADSNAGIF